MTTISKSTNYSILALMVTAGFMVGFVLASMMRMAPPGAAVNVGEQHRETSALPLQSVPTTTFTADGDLDADSSVSPSVSDDEKEKETKQEEATMTTTSKKSSVEIAQSKEVQQQEQPQSTIDTTTTTTSAEHHHYQQFPSDMDHVNALFAKMEATKQVQLEPTEDFFHMAVTRDTFAKRIAGEVALKKSQSNYFYAIPDLDPSMGGVALFTNAFIVGDPPVIFDGNIVYHQESCGPPLPRTYYDTIMRRVTRSETGVGPIKIEPTSNTANNQQQQDTDDSLDILATTWHGDCYYHAIMESLPRLTYVQDFVTRHKEKVRIWTRPGNCLDGDRPNQIWNPALFSSTTATTIADTDDTPEGPWWGGHIPRQVLFAKRLLVPTSSHCFLQPEPGKVLQRILHQYFSGTASAPPPQLQQSIHVRSTTERPMILLQHRTGSRSIINAAALRQGLVDAFSNCCDVQDFYPPDDATTLATYAALHNAATIVVGPHGSGLANILFCDPSRIRGMVEIHPKFYNHRMDKNDCHQKSAERLGIPTVMLMAPDGDWFQPFTANIDEVVTQVQKMLAAGAQQQ